ncbi:hypothetical protein [Enterococcus caccae]|uniref:Uncharacterized protein n=1 Tax=Enterococcus caccae ATCC BAA-1240 TaxID=1158612 RepID=R3WFX1_9ENTE|nr:hypothetical protein [Enterococcus caccae]EOL46357.1 hypothetical protein UC7_01324 [Enterococcus caccae ATCC BAA-1240]EOT60726.1 hypothetical protein I580_01626 [Enterococcus caccae ATCC BAA-1240]OJG27464.1 hypothetical protein RU98_GL002553 [Enterococcus caccae]
MKKEGQSLKMIPYQDITDLQHTLDRLQSWEEPLAVLDHFFQFRKGPINKKQVVKEYYACGHLFHAFFEEFLRLMAIEEVKVRKLDGERKVSSEVLRK